MGRGGGAARLDSQLDVSDVSEDTSETSSISARRGQLELGILPSGEGKAIGDGGDGRKIHAGANRRGNLIGQLTHRRAVRGKTGALSEEKPMGW